MIMKESDFFFFLGGGCFAKGKFRVTVCVCEREREREREKYVFVRTVKITCLSCLVENSSSGWCT